MGPLFEVDAKEEQSDYDKDLYSDRYAVVDQEISFASLPKQGIHDDQAD